MKAPTTSTNAVPKTATPLLLASLLALGIPLNLAATPPPAGVAPFLAPAGGLAIDGNLITGTPVANVGDWLICTNVAPPGTAGAVLDKNGAPLDISRTFHLIDLYNANNDTTFTGGHKWFDDPNTWQWTTSKASSKTDINNVLLHVGQDCDGGGSAQHERRLLHRFRVPAKSPHEKQQWHVHIRRAARRSHRQ